MYFIVPLLLVCLSLMGGCASLPDVSQVIDATPLTEKPPEIASAGGLLSPQQSKAILERLQRSVDPTDLLERNTAVLEAVTDSPMTKGNRVSLLADGEATYAAMFKAILSARNHINLESYTFNDDDAGRKFAALLLQKRAEGVPVHLIYDSVGSLTTPESFFQRLREAGVQVVGFNPLNPLKLDKLWGITHRDHRKILITDGQLAIIGGVNITQAYSSGPSAQKSPGGKGPIHWRDTDVQIEGPSVAELQKLFLATWQRQKGPAISGPDYFPLLTEKGKDLVRVVGSTPGESNRIPFIVYVSALDFARNSIHLTNSYFVPDAQIEKALIDAAKRGVEVKILLPGVTDSKLVLYAQRYHYARLLKAGVRIYERSDALLHAKTAVIDGVWSTVGSTNLDSLSLRNNDEVNAVILSREFAVAMEQMFARDLADSRPILWEDWQKRPLFPRIGEWFVNLFMRWL